MVGLARQWNTWDARDPLAMLHLPTGLCLRFSVFSNKRGDYRPLGVGDGVTLLEHTPDAGYVRARVAHADSLLELTIAKPDAHGLCARLRVLRVGEWGLRYWFALEAGFAPLDTVPASWRPDEPWMEVENAEPLPPAGPPRLTGRHRSLWLSLAASDPAVFAGAYDDIAQFADDVATRGYYAAPPLARRGRWGVLRFNAQMHPDLRIAATFGTDRAMAEARAAAMMAAAPAHLAAAATRAAEPDEAAQAVRDVVAWNTIWDAVHHRPTTVLTRNWLAKKFSGWGVWLDDMLFHALLAALCGDWEMMRANLDAALDTQCPDGNFACLRTGTQEWVDRSQSPVGAYVLWRVYRITGDRTLLAQHYPALLAAHRWWLARRDGNGDGLIEYGSSPTGTGAFVHTKQAAMDESLMDNHPMFDDAGFDDAAHTMTMADPGLNSLVSLDAQCLARIAAELGDDAEVAPLRATAARLNALISERLWDAARGVFAGRHWSGEFARSLGATSFYPLLCGAATEAQATTLIERHLLRPEEFWGERVLPSSSHDDPASADNVYWRGRIWPPHLFLVWEGLRRAGDHDTAGELARRAWRMFAGGWRDGRACRENYHRNDPAGDDSPDSDPFYTWGALIPAMRMLDAADASPWQDRLFQPDGDTPAVLREAGRHWRAHRQGPDLHVAADGAPWLVAGPVARVALRDRAGHVSIVATPLAGAGGVVLRLPAITVTDVLRIEIDGDAASPAAEDGHLTLRLPAGGPRRVDLWHREPRHAG